MTTDQREEVVYYLKRLYERGLTTSSGGNISLRTEAGSVLITPSGPDKGNLPSERICEVSLENGELIKGNDPSMETAMHLKIMRSRPDVSAVIHAHAVISTAFSATGKKIDTGLTGETRLVLGDPVIVPYERMGSEELAAAVAEAAGGADVIIMENHGPLCVGSTLAEAFSRIEVLEEAARITLITEILGNRKELGATELEAIDRLRGS